MSNEENAIKLSETPTDDAAVGAVYTAIGGVLREYTDAGCDSRVRLVGILNAAISIVSTNGPVPPVVTDADGVVASMVNIAESAINGDGVTRLDVVGVLRIAETAAVEP